MSLNKFRIYLTLMTLALPYYTSWSITFQQWDRLNSDLNSANATKRLAAVKEASSIKDERAVILLKDRLLLELDFDVAKEILLHLAERSARKDFFYILDFLKITSFHDLAISSIRLLYKIHSPRLQYELEKLFEENKGKVFSILFIEAISEPSEKDIRWMHQVILSFDLLKYWSSFSKNSHIRESFLSNIRPYIINLKNKKSIFWSYWVLKSENFSGSLESSFKTPIIKNSQIEKLSAAKQKEYLNLVVKYFPGKLKASNLILSLSPYVRYWLLKHYFISKRIGSQTGFTASEEIWQQIIEAELRTRSLRMKLLLSLNFEYLQEKYKEFYLERCIKHEINIPFCITAFHLASDKRILDYWFSLSSLEIIACISTSYSTIMRDLYLTSNTKVINTLLTIQDERILASVVLNMPDALLKKYKLLLVSHWFSSTNHRFRFLLPVRIAMTQSLIPEYRGLLPENLLFGELKVFKITKKEELDKKIKKDVTQVGKNDLKQTTKQNVNKELVK